MDVDLTTQYLGLTLSSPLIAAASPCTGQPDVLREMEACGAGAAVLPSLFEEQIRRAQGAPHRQAAEAGDDSVGSFPYLGDYNRGADAYLRLVEEAKRAVSMPIIASINGVSLGTWVAYARRMAGAGADAIELNLYFIPTDTAISGQQVEAQYLDVIAAVRAAVDIPIAVKVGPFFSSLPYFARQAVETGANGLVLFNRYLEPEINLESHAVEPHLELSRPGEVRLPLRWLAILHGQLGDCCLAATSGVHAGSDVLKALAAGANVVMIASALLKHGVSHLQTLRGEVVEWLDNHDYPSLRPFVGCMGRDQYQTPEAFERANYASTLASYLEQGACPTEPAE